MTRILAVLALLAVAILPCQLPPCESDDGSGPGVACYWDATRHGNGQGDSFWIDRKGGAHY